MQRLRLNPAQKFIQLILPDLCQSCGRVGRYLCDYCVFTKVKWCWQQECHVCRAASYSGLVHAECAAQTSLDGVLVCAKYDGVVKDMLHKLKFNFYFDLARPLAELMSARLLERVTLFDEAAVTFVPLASMRKRWRGFNQAELLAQGVCGLRGWGVRNLLVKGEGGHSQVGLGKSERARNLSGSFALAGGTDLPRRVFVIDDVFTTGATLEECAKVLKGGGVQEVYGVVLAAA